MTVVWRSSSAGMLVIVTEHVSAATLLVACVDSVPPVPGRAGKLRSSTDDAGSRKRRGFSGKLDPVPAKHCQGMRLPAGHGGPWQQAGALGISRGLHGGQAEFEDGSGAGDGSFLS